MLVRFLCVWLLLFLGLFGTGCGKRIQLENEENETFLFPFSLSLLSPSLLSFSSLSFPLPLILTKNLVVVGRHPRQKNESAPVVAEVADDQSPDGRAGQQLLPGDRGRSSARP